MYPYILTNKNLTIIIDSKQYTISSTHYNFDKIIKRVKRVKRVKTDNITGLLELISIKDKIKGDTFGNIIIGDNDKIYYMDKEIHTTLTKKIIEMYRHGFPIKSMINFLENLLQNPSEASINELYDFMEAGNLPITEDGYFLAYKKVNIDFTDCHSNTFDNSVGCIVEMERNDVNSDRNETCSAGLHFCSKDYLSVYSAYLPVVILKINPRDVVSIPSDYNNTKGRCCRYEVIATYEDYSNIIFDKPVATDIVLNMKPKQKIAYNVLLKIIEDVNFMEIGDIDLSTLKSDLPDMYESIIMGIINDFPNEITRDTAVRYFKFLKENF